MKILPFFQLKLPFPSFGVHEEVRNLMKKSRKSKKDELPKFWTVKERLIVSTILIGTVLLSIIFWYKGNGGRVEINLPKFDSLDFGETVVIEK